MPFIPDVILLGQFPLASLAVTALLGVGLAYWLTGFMARRSPVDPEAAKDLMVNLFIGGFLGAKLIYVAIDPGGYVRNPGLLILFPYGPLALPGALAGGLLAAGLGLRRRSDWLSVLDQGAVPLVFGAGLALAGWKAPGSWAFAPLVLAAAAGAAVAGRFGGSGPVPGRQFAQTAVMAACAVALADLARPGGTTTALQVGAAAAGTLAWLLHRRLTGGTQSPGA